jgi:fatty acid desaturase
MRALYRYREDISPSLVVFSVFLIQLGTFFYVDSLWAVAAVMLSLLACSAMPGSISHNHHHVSTFTQSWLNRIYEVILFLEVGILPYAWTLHHNLGHHKEYLDQEKDPANWRLADGRLMSRVRYDIVGALRIYPEIAKIGPRYPELYRRFKFWAFISLSVLAVFIALDPLKALLLFVAPMPIMYLGLLDNTYMQHCGLDTNSELTASRNTSNRLYNFISWNLGYHTAHHMKPHLHWSRLPAFHAQIAAQIPPSMVCNSVLLSACTYEYLPPAPKLVRPRLCPLLLPQGRPLRWRPAQNGLRA